MVYVLMFVHICEPTTTTIVYWVETYTSIEIWSKTVVPTSKTGDFGEFYSVCQNIIRTIDRTCNIESGGETRARYSHHGRSRERVKSGAVLPVATPEPRTLKYRVCIVNFKYLFRLFSTFLTFSCQFFQSDFSVFT